MNIPNCLTVFRLGLIPVFAAVYFSTGEHRLFLSMVVFVAAGVTDLLDGYIARKYNLITRLGTLLDPLADKLMLLTVLLCLSYSRYIPFWVLGIVALKELAMVAGGVYLYVAKTKLVIPANGFGKAATAAFYLAILLIGLTPWHRAGLYGLYAAVLLTVIALVRYHFTASAAMKKTRDQS